MNERLLTDNEQETALPDTGIPSIYDEHIALIIAQDRKSVRLNTLVLMAKVDAILAENRMEIDLRLYNQLEALVEAERKEVADDAG